MESINNQIYQVEEKIWGWRTGLRKFYIKNINKNGTGELGRVAHAYNSITQKAEERK